jgi:bifunctional non-homologous end joining protein LigD
MHMVRAAPRRIPRARAGAPVSTPLDWEELDGIKGADAYTLANLPQRLATLKQDSWADFFHARQSITDAMRKERGAE